MGNHLPIRYLAFDYYLFRLHVASQSFHRQLSKKKVCEAIGDNEKLLPVDALGVVMIQHGEEFGDDSAFGPRPSCLLHEA